MKKITLLAAVAALATAGGVFAAWTFDNTSAPADQQGTISSTIEENITNNTSGSVAVSGELTFSISTDGTTNNNSIVAAFAGDGITVTYSKAAEGVDSGCYVTATMTGKSYDVDGDSTNDIVINNFTGTKTQLNDGGSYTVTKDMLNALIPSITKTVRTVEEAEDLIAEVKTWVFTVNFDFTLA